MRIIGGAFGLLPRQRSTRGRETVGQGSNSCARVSRGNRFLVAADARQHAGRREPVEDLGRERRDDLTRAVDAKEPV
jgi:hypothetical protein